MLWIKGGSGNYRRSAKKKEIFRKEKYSVSIIRKKERNRSRRVKIINRLLGNRSNGDDKIANGTTVLLRVKVPVGRTTMKIAFVL